VGGAGWLAIIGLSREKKKGRRERAEEGQQPRRRKGGGIAFSFSFRRGEGGNPLPAELELFHWKGERGKKEACGITYER